jgi:hypothetical protein
MSIHDSCVGKSDEWYTPRYVFDALGCTFDVDVAAPFDLTHVSVPTDRWILAQSLETEWRGFAWMNAPFGGRNGLLPWLKKFFQHGNGIALTPDRTSAPWWQQYAPQSDAVLFVDGKIKFIDRNGNPGKSPADGTTLMAIGHAAVAALNNAANHGFGYLSYPASRHTSEVGS